jgi:hypothetical protein
MFRLNFWYEFCGTCRRRSGDAAWSCTSFALNKTLHAVWIPLASILKTVVVLWSLAGRLLSLLGRSPRWMILLLRLICFALLISPALIQLVPYYAFNTRIFRGVRYGPHRRNDYDIHVPAPGVSFGSAGPAPHGRPVVILVCGGAWMIGYKLWTLALCRTLAACGIIAVSIDYRNFPQVTASGMVHDVSTAIAAVLASDDIARADGDPRLV